MTMTKQKKKQIIDIVLFIVLSAGAIIMIMPLAWMISTSLKTQDAAFVMPPKWIPDPVVTKNFFEVWGKGPLLDGFINTMTVELFVIVAGTLVSSLAAFAFAKLRFPHKNKIFLMLIGTMMIPFPVVMIPQFVVFSKLNWIDTLKPLIIPGMFGNVFMIFFLRQYISSLPDSLIEAAKIDGCSFFGIFWKIIMPLIKPALSAQVILWFMGIWNDYLAPTIYISTPEKMTIQAVIASFNSFYAIQSNFPMIMTASVISMLPIIVVFIIFQKYIVESIAVSGIKE